MLVCDVAGAPGGTAFVQAATEALGGIDILITNAGGPPPGNFAATEVDAYPGAIALNLMSVVAMCKAAVPPMQERGWGRVVAITSLAVRQPMPDLILSNTARAGATGFLKTLAREVAGDGVTVNSVQPGLHRTDRVKELYGDAADEMPMGDAGRLRRDRRLPVQRAGELPHRRPDPHRRGVLPGVAVNLG